MAQAPANPGEALVITIVEGQGAINNVQAGTMRIPVVRVQGESDRNVKGAIVTFTLPSSGPGGTFSDGSTTLIVQSDEAGLAAARGIRPNRLAGQFQIRVLATFGPLTGRASITQTNAVAAPEGKQSKRFIVLGLIGGAVAAGVLASTMGGGGPAPSQPGPSTPPPVTIIRPGTPGFGPP